MGRDLTFCNLPIIFTIKFNKIVKLNGKESNMTTEDQILEAATRVFLQKGYGAARMDEIAKEAGINRALLHYYFRSKEKMFELVFSTKFKSFFSGVAGVLSSDLPIFEKVRALVDVELSILSLNADLPVFIFGELNRDPKRLFDLIQANHFSLQEIIIKLEAQLEREHAEGKIKKISAVSFLMNVMGLCIYPFIAKNIVTTVAGIDKQYFLQLAASRKEELTRFIIDGLKA